MKMLHNARSHDVKERNSWTLLSWSVRKQRHDLFGGCSYNIIHTNISSQYTSAEAQESADEITFKITRSNILFLFPHFYLELRQIAHTHKY